MKGGRHCIDCGEPLEVHEFERCTMCAPTLSARAKAIGEMRRSERLELEQAERSIQNVEGLIRKLQRSTRK